ncbi:hypothetical protein, partial [Candidatus Xenohaliotis californiensis]|uniref:hypothetical protein n=1 Tax=Candidatus Xenohaliotis californiensis TaxID=84677 RepID=UPI0030C8A59A
MIVLIQADSFAEINFIKDDTFYIATTAINRGHSVFWITPALLSCADDIVLCNPFNGESLEEFITLDLPSVDLLLIRQNPPVNDIYLANISYLAKMCKKFDIVAINPPYNINNFLEKKLPSLVCPEFTPRTMFVDSINKDKLGFFLYDILFDKTEYIIKPLNLFAGQGVHKMTKTGNIDSDIKQILKFLQNNFIVQEFLNGIENGDRRISVI